MKHHHKNSHFAMHSSWHGHHWGRHPRMWSAHNMWWLWFLIPVVFFFGFSIFVKFWWLWVGLGVFAVIAMSRQGWACSSAEKAKNDEKPKRDFMRSYDGSEYEIVDDEPPTYRV